MFTLYQADVYPEFDVFVLALNPFLRETKEHSGEPDQTPQNMTSDKGLHSLLTLYSYFNNNSNKAAILKLEMHLSYSCFVCCFDSKHANKQFFVNVGLDQY